jgi:hypothetical protein
MEWVIKTLEAQVGQFLLGCKCPVSRFLPGRAKDLAATLHVLYLRAFVSVLIISKLLSALVWRK